MKRMMIASLALTVTFTTAAFAQETRYNDLADLPFQRDYPTAETAQRLTDELLFEDPFLALVPGKEQEAAKQATDCRTEKAVPSTPRHQTKRRSRSPKQHIWRVRISSFRAPVTAPVASSIACPSPTGITHKRGLRGT
jgi:hypothetical protein